MCGNITLIKMKTQEQKRILFKKIVKHGNQAIIVIPKVLEKRLKPGTLTRLVIGFLEDEK